MSRLVLIVDDSPQIAANLEIAITGLDGLEVATVGGGEEALRLIEHTEPPIAAVITDLDMPRIDGFELIRRLRADPRYTRLPIIVSSGNCDPDAPTRALATGADAYFTKPYSPAQLRSKLELLLAQRES